MDPIDEWISLKSSPEKEPLTLPVLLLLPLISALRTPDPGRPCSRFYFRFSPPDIGHRTSDASRLSPLASHNAPSPRKTQAGSRPA